MKSPQKLQQKLLGLLHSHPNLHVMPYPEQPWTELHLREVCGVVSDYLRKSDNVLDYDPLKDWLEEAQFYLADLKPR